MTRCSRNLLRAGLAVLAPVLAVILLEVICRIVGLGHPVRFLVSFERNGEAVWIDNQLFGYRFFAPAVSRASSIIVTPQYKQPNEYRIVVLGESAAMGEPEPAYGPARMLEFMIAQKMPDRRVTVINAAMTAINSHVIREIARDLPRLQPDAVILYIGNNEVVGPYGPGTVFHSHIASPMLNRTRVLLTRLHLVAAMRSFWFNWKGSDDQVWRGMEMFTQNRVPANDPRLDSVYRSFEQNLRAIVRNIRHAGAVPIISTVAVNLANQAPFDGRNMENSDLQYLKQTRDADALRFRADSTINRIIRTVAAEDPNVKLIDAEQVFEQDGPPGYAYFVDHVHFNLPGSYLLARQWSEAWPDSSRTIPTYHEISDKLLWNPYNAIDLVETMKSRSMKPPFTFTQDNSERLYKWSTELATLYRTAQNTPLDEWILRYRERIAAYPDDSYFPHQAVRALLMEDRFQDAGELLHHMHQLAPHRADIRGWMVIIAAIAGRTDRAWGIMTEQEPDLGELPADMLVSASETLMQSGYREESVTILKTAAERYPHRLRLQALLASRLAQTGNIQEALARFQQLIGKHPGALWIKEEYAILLGISGDIAGAEKNLEHLRTSTIPDEQLKWIQLQVFQRNYSAAEQKLRAMYAQDENYTQALHMLVQINLIQHRYETAAADLQPLLEKEMWNGNLWLQAGQVYERLNRTSDAITAYRNAIPLLVDPDFAVQALTRLSQPLPEQ